MHEQMTIERLRIEDVRRAKALYAKKKTRSMRLQANACVKGALAISQCA